MTRKLTIGCACFLLLAPLLFGAEWHALRGPTGMGFCAEKMLIEWQKKDILWSKEIEGEGQSSIVQAGDKIFVTSAKENNLRFLYCLDRKNGDLLWQKEIQNERIESIHRMNGWATATPVTDGKYVVVFFGPAGMHCFDIEGNKKWSMDLGEFPSHWGVAASPIIHNGLVIQNCDAIGKSRLVAMHLETGKIAWETPRIDKPKGGWSTPIVILVQGKEQLVLNGEFGVKGYSIKDGKELWFCESFNGRGSPVPFYDGKLVFVINGKPGDLYAVDPTGSGNITKTHMKWHARRNGGRDLPSPASVQGLVFATSMSGIITCYDAKTGKIYWVDRLKGAFSGSPTVSANFYYIQSEAGTTFVIKPDKEKLIIRSQNSLIKDDTEVFRSTLSPIENKIYTRSHSKVYCIQKK
ncbi:MAG: PQQ-binding-like beta-propeller repeat protein [Opitutae bacterium]|nr:PQQ-binding-like beta-propeller repeat protein [Opitutae bacterium]